MTNQSSLSHMIANLGRDPVVVKVEDPASASVFWPAPCSNTGTDAGDVTHHREADDRSHKPMFDLLFFGFFFFWHVNSTHHQNRCHFRSSSLSHQNIMSASSMEIKFKEEKYSVHPSKSLWRHSLIILFSNAYVILPWISPSHKLYQSLKHSRKS